MRIFQTSAICLLGAGWLASSTPADGQGSGDNFHRGIGHNNSFDLKPAPAAAAQDAQTPPPEIILNGIMTALGDRSALFKLASPQASGKQFYFLSEGERAGGIELLSVDVKAGTIKVRNHGVIQVIALCQPPRLLSIPGAAAPGGDGGINLPGNQGFPSGNGQTGQTAGGKTPGVAVGQFTQSGYVWSVGIPELPATKLSANNNNNTGSQNTGTANTGSANSGTADSGTASTGTANTPAPQTPAPQAPASQTPGPQTPGPQTPALQALVLQAPAPQTLALQTPGPQTPALQTPASQTPALQALQALALQTPGPQTPALQTPVSQTLARKRSSRFG